MKIEPFKMRVTPEQSKRVQEIIFENGGEWRSGNTTVINTNVSCLAFDLHGDGDGISGWTAPSTGFPPFMDAAVPEITYDEFINKYVKQMKNLKLEVGKTYLNRNGERVKIVKETGHEIFPFDGDDRCCYTPNGGYWTSEKNSHLDLVAEADAPPTFRTFKIPENTREISVSEMDGRIVIEFVPEAKGPKPGDVMVNGNRSVYIFKGVADIGEHRHYAWFGVSGRLAFGTHCNIGRIATPEEAQPLWDALKKAGKRWNPDTLKIEELTERERIRAWLKNGGQMVNGVLVSVIEDYIKHREAQQ